MVGLNQYRDNTYSQNGEDGVISEILRRIGLKKGIYVEFGAADGYFCSNTRALAEKGWSGLMYDLQDNGDVVKCLITPENVSENVPACDVLSIDIDGNDYKVWEAYTEKPAVVVIEVNSSFEPGVIAIHGVHGLEGSSFSSMLALAERKGYFLVCHTGNMIFVDQRYLDLFPEAITEPETLFDNAWL